MTEHTYPSNYPPGTHWAVDAAWKILDSVKPGVLSDDVRAYLAGQIAGRLMMERGDNTWTGPMLEDTVLPGRVPGGAWKPEE